MGFHFFCNFAIDELGIEGNKKQKI
jgi:hypothetical protein